jgi:hypothetical protein
MKKMQWLLGFVLSVFVLIMLGSCGRKVIVQKDDNFQAGKIRTYAWVAGTQKDSLTQKPKVNDLTDRRIRSIIDKNLQKNGWKESNQKPDVLLVYDVDVARENRNISDPVYTQPMTRWFYSPYGRRYVPVYYPSEFLGYDNRTQTYREGTLTLTVMNANTEKTIWQGSTSSELNGRKMSDKEINENAKAIIKKLG